MYEKYPPTRIAIKDGPQTLKNTEKWKMYMHLEKPIK